MNAIVKVEFGEKSYGESPKVECSPENPAEFNFNSTINVTFEDPLTLDELACKPILCKQNKALVIALIICSTID